VRHRWITEQRFIEQLNLFVREYNLYYERGRFMEPIPIPDPDRANAAAAAIVALSA